MNNFAKYSDIYSLMTAISEKFKSIPLWIGTEEEHTTAITNGEIPSTALVLITDPDENNGSGNGSSGGGSGSGSGNGSGSGSGSGGSGNGGEGGGFGGAFAAFVLAENAAPAGICSVIVHNGLIPAAAACK